MLIRKRIDGLLVMGNRHHAGLILNSVRKQQDLPLVVMDCPTMPHSDRAFRITPSAAVIWRHPAFD